MRRAAVAGIVALIIGPTATQLNAASPDGNRQAAERLVDAALEADVTGDSQRRTALLSEALRVDPDSAPARWQRGQVRYNNEWRTLAEVESLVQSDDRRAEYDLLRSEIEDAPDDHRELARWCDRVGLTGQGHYHWLRILADDAEDAEAREALGLYEYEGGLATSAEIARHKAETKQARDDFGRFSARFDRWLRDAASPETPRQAEALQRFAEVNDPAALPALEWATTVRAAQKRGPLGKLPRPRAGELRRDLALALMAAMNSMPQHEATLRLAEYAVFSDWPEVRQRAAQALKPRPSTDYVPQWMAALTAPIEVDVAVYAAGERVDLHETVRQAGAEVDLAHIRSTGYETVRLNSNPGRRLDFSGSQLRLAAQRANETLARAAAANEEAAARNERILAALDITTGGLKLGDAPQVWWQAWQDYNELYTAERPTIEESESSEFTNYTMSCFIQGTPVWTEAGLTPIERILPGDLVLAQHPETGELAYRPVLATTLRPPSRLVSVEVGGETIITTRGHRFWVDGQGWEMAKFLKPSMRLHAVEGGVELTTVSEFADGETMEAYNLVVDDFHTYFVGQSKLLVCDNSCPRPTLAKTPGLVLAPAAASSTSASNNGSR